MAGEARPRRRRTSVRIVAWAIAGLAGAGCHPATPAGPTPLAPRTLLGELDTAFQVPRGRPFGAAASPQGLVYVTLLGNLDAISTWDFGHRTYRHAAIKTGVTPTNVAFGRDGRSAFVATQRSFRVQRVNVRAARVNRGWYTPANDPYQVAVSLDGRLVYATGNAGWVYAYDTRTGRSEGAVEVDAAPNGLALSPDGRRLYITHLRSPWIGVLTLPEMHYTRLARMDNEEGQGIIVSPDGQVIYAASEDADRLYAFDAMTGRRLNVVEAGESPFGVALTPDGTEIWVTTLAGELRRYRRADLALVAVNPLGGRLRRIAMDPAGRGAVIADESGRILVLR